MLAITLITEITYLFSERLASFRWQELYLGLFTELGNLLMDDRLVKATEKGFATSQREIYNRNNREVEYRSYKQRRTHS